MTFSDLEIADIYADEVASGRQPRAQNYVVDYPEHSTSFTTFHRSVRLERERRSPGRPDMSSRLVMSAIRSSGRALSGKELRAATGLKKTTVEIALLRLRKRGYVVRYPEAWNGPSADYIYGLSSRISELVGAVDPVYGRAEASSSVLAADPDEA